MTPPSHAYLLHRLVAEMDKSADDLLQQKFGISYRKAYFLAALHRHEKITQHQLAQALGYSDPSVSSMLSVLAQEGYVVVTPSPEHKRKRLVSLTDKGVKDVEAGLKFLDEQFEQVVGDSGIDAKLYLEQTAKLYNSLAQRKNNS